MAEENSNGLESTNINLKWLSNIYEQIIYIESLVRLCREGCSSLVEYLAIPPDQRGIVLPDAQFKNLRFLALEMDMLIDNLSPVLAEKTDVYKQRIEKVLAVADNRNLFLKPVLSSEKQIKYYQTLPLMSQTISYLSSIVSFLIKDIGNLLFISPTDIGKKKW